MRQSYRNILGAAAIALGLGASASAITPLERLNLVNAAVSVEVPNVNRPTQKNCALGRYGMPLCEGIIQARETDGDPDPTKPEVHLESYLISPNAWGSDHNERSSTLAVEPDVILATNPITRDSASDTGAEEYLKIALTCGANTVRVNNLFDGATGAIPMNYITCPQLDAAIKGEDFGHSTLDEKVALALKWGLRGVFLHSGNMCDAEALIRKDGNVYRITVLPLCTVANPGQMELRLENVNASSNPLYGDLVLETSNIASVITPDVCFADRVNNGQTHDTIDYQCLGAQSQLRLNIARLTGDANDEPIYADGFETGDTTNWSTTTP